MLLHPALVALSAISHAVVTRAVAAPGTEWLTAPPSFQPTQAPSPDPALSFTLSCWCETIPYLTTMFCLPCSTVYFTGTNTATTTAVTAQV
ncbi:hypothetical protein DFH07DRAFT_252651 [Mycena maculata]|uniref:Uncharacterized protein n=1 Tax=Mycena maculata TaxID=230809 RepID=A0AAD7HQW3_9AGAR|nr:hypothetical protein DFH07DRAFT_252651 [Mycena maculata]